MRFIVDAQLPQKLALWIGAQGFDAIHTLSLPAKNLTDDKYIIALSIAFSERVIVPHGYDKAVCIA